MVASTPTGSAETKTAVATAYAAICKTLRTDTSLSVVVVNHIAAKHKVHTLPSFHTSREITDDEKLDTYRELLRALAAIKTGEPRETALAGLLGQVAAGQAGEEQAPATPATPRIDLAGLNDPPPPPPPPVAKPPPAPAPAPVAPVANKPVRQSGQSLVDAIRTIVAEEVAANPPGAPAIDEARIRAIVREEIANAFKRFSA